MQIPGEILHQRGLHVRPVRNHLHEPLVDGAGRMANRGRIGAGEGTPDLAD